MVSLQRTNLERQVREMTHVHSRDELESNIRQLSLYLQSTRAREKTFALSLVKRGTCFVVTANADGSPGMFCPSRFVGYARNSLRGHLGRRKDGRETNDALASLLGSEPTENPALEVHYRNYCRSLGFEHNKSGAFGVQRKFWLLPGIVFLDDIDEAETDIQDLKSRKDLKPTQRQALILARRGQGQFRQDLIATWKGCAVLGCTILSVLRASHIKPWKKSTDSERLDSSNGLLLVATFDALFDKGLISFNDDGVMLISSKLGAEDTAALGLKGRLRNVPTQGQKSYLEFHRRHVFID